MPAKQPKPHNKPAQLTVATYEVNCPHCGEFQPNPDNGGHLWVPDEVRACEGVRKCVGCDVEFCVVAP